MRNATKSTNKVNKSFDKIEKISKKYRNSTYFNTIKSVSKNNFLHFTINYNGMNFSN